MNESTQAEIQKHFKVLRQKMIKQIEEDIDKKLEQLKVEIIRDLEDQTKTWSKAIYDRAWQKGKQAF